MILFILLMIMLCPALCAEIIPDSVFLEIYTDLLDTVTIYFNTLDGAEPDTTYLDNVFIVMLSKYDYTYNMFKETVLLRSDSLAIAICCASNDWDAESCLKCFTIKYGDVNRDAIIETMVTSHSNYNYKIERGD